MRTSRMLCIHAYAMHELGCSPSGFAGLSDTGDSPTLESKYSSATAHQYSRGIHADRGEPLGRAAQQGAPAALRLGHVEPGVDHDGCLLYTSPSPRD